MGVLLSRFFGQAQELVHFRLPNLALIDRDILVALTTRLRVANKYATVGLGLPQLPAVLRDALVC